MSSYEFVQVSLNYYDCQNSLPSLKSLDSFLCDAPAQTLQMVCRNLDTAYRNFFEERADYPAFKRKHGKQSLHFPQGVRLGDQTIWFPKLGNIDAVIHRPLQGKIKTVTLSKNPSGQYHASLSVEDGQLDPKAETVTLEGVVGVDLGIKHFATFSDGTRIENPKFFRKNRKRITRLSRRLSRCKKGSNRRMKARLKLAKARQKETDQRKDFLHKLTSQLIGENQAVAIEDLHVKGLQKNSKIAVSISEVAFGEFRRQLEYKAKRQGKTVSRIDRFFPSSKQCNHCKRINHNLKLSDRFWLCDCGELVDREWNAALNLRDEAIKNLVPTDRGECTLAENAVSKTLQ